MRTLPTTTTEGLIEHMIRGGAAGCWSRARVTRVVRTLLGDRRRITAIIVARRLSDCKWEKGSHVAWAERESLTGTSYPDLERALLSLLPVKFHGRTKAQEAWDLVTGPEWTPRAAAREWIHLLEEWRRP